MARTLAADLRRHPHKRELEAIAKKFSDLWDTPGVGQAIDEVVEAESGFFHEIECDDLWHPGDGQHRKMPDMPLDDLYNLRKEKWIPLFRKKDKKFDALCKQFLDLYLSGIDNPKRAYAALSRALIENFWGEFEREYGKNTIGGEFFEREYGLLRDECDDWGYIQKWGRSSSDRRALIRLASTMPKGSPERRVILAGLREANTTNVPGIHILDSAQVYGNAEVYDEAKVFGRAKVFDNAKVFGRSWVFGRSQVLDQASVAGKAKVSGDAQVYDEAKVHGDAEVSGDAQVYGRAKVFDSALVFDNAQVFGRAKVSGDAQVYGNAKVSGDARLSRNARIGGDAEILGGDWDGSESVTWRGITSGRWKAPGVPA